MVGVDKAAGAAQTFAAPSPIGEKAFGQVGAAPVGGVTTPFAGVFKSLVEQSQTLGKQAQEAVTGPVERAGRRDTRRDDCVAEGECFLRAGIAGEEQGGVGVPAADGNAVLRDVIKVSVAARLEKAVAAVVWSIS